MEPKPCDAWVQRALGRQAVSSARNLCDAESLAKPLWQNWSLSDTLGVHPKKAQFGWHGTGGGGGNISAG